MTDLPPRPRATLREVADRAGVSIKTVTNVMHERPNVRESTRERVLAAIGELGYRPNLSARNLAGVKVVPSGRVTARDVMDTAHVVATKDAIEKLQEALG